MDGFRAFCFFHPPAARYVFHEPAGRVGRTMRPGRGNALRPVLMRVFECAAEGGVENTRTLIKAHRRQFKARDGRKG